MKGYVVQRDSRSSAHDLRHTPATLLQLSTVAFVASFDRMEYHGGVPGTVTAPCCRDRSAERAC